MLKLTKRLIESTTVTPGQDSILWDSKVKGFGVRIRGGGTKTFILQYRTVERKEKVTPQVPLQRKSDTFELNRS